MRDKNRLVPFFVPSLFSYKQPLRVSMRNDDHYDNDEKKHNDDAALPLNC